MVECLLSKSSDASHATYILDTSTLMRIGYLNWHIRFTPLTPVLFNEKTYTPELYIMRNFMHTPNLYNKMKAVVACTGTVYGRIWISIRLGDKVNPILGM